MKVRHGIRTIWLVAGVSIGIFVASRFAMSSTRMVVLAASQYVQEIISFK